MSFDGIPRPSQLNPYGDAMNPYRAANAARTDQAAQPMIKKLEKEEQVKALQKEQREYPQTDEDEGGETFSEEEAEQILLFAKMRGILNVALESGVRYEFQINHETGFVDLLEAATGNLVLQLLPEELMQLSEKIHRYAGMLTDRNG